MNNLRVVYDKLLEYVKTQEVKPDHLRIKKLILGENEDEVIVKFNPNTNTGIGAILKATELEHEGELVIRFDTRYYYHEPHDQDSEVILDSYNQNFAVKIEENIDNLIEKFFNKILPVTEHFSGLLFSSADCRGIDEGIFKKLKEVDLLNERTNKALYDRCIFAYDEQSVTLFVRLFDGSASHYKLARGSDEVFIQLFEEFLASMEYSLPVLFEAYGQTLVASSRLCPVAEVSETFNEAMGVKIGTCCREHTSHYAFVFYAGFEGSRMEHSFILDKGPTKSFETLSALCNGLENLISVSKREMLSSVYRLERGLKVANRVYSALGEDTKKRLEMEAPRLEWKEPLLSNYPRIVIPVIAEQRFVAAQLSEKEVWFVLEDAKGNLLYGLDFWIMDDSPDEGIRAAFDLSRPFFDVEAIEAVSASLDVPITLNGVRLGKVTTGSSVLPRVMKIVIESVPLIAFASLIVIDKETKQRLTVTTDLAGDVARKVESFAKYANDLFKDFKYFS